MLHNDNNDDDASQIFPETETRRTSEYFSRDHAFVTAKGPVAEGILAIEAALRKEPGRPTLPSMSDTLVARGKVHGEFANNALIAQRLKSVMRDTMNWDALTDTQREALENIAQKIARLLSGDPNHKDGWHDIQGYARLVEDRL